MPLTEILISTLGPAIARLILGRWLSSDLDAAISGTLVDLLKQKTSDVIAQRRANRQFEAIGEEVALSLEPLFEGEAYSEAVAIAVGETLQRTRLTPGMLATNNLEPGLLADTLLRDSASLTQGFSAEETTLYQRIIQEACEQIIEIASQLPAFTEKTLSEILQREDQLLKITRETLELVRNMRTASDRDNQSSASAQFELAYRRELLRRLDVLELFGVQASAASRRHSLSIAYITLQIRRQPIGVIRTTQTKGRKNKIKPTASHAETISQPVDKILEETTRLLVRGEAGSGKTTLLQWIAVKTVSGTFEGRLQSWNYRIPFFLPLRGLADSAYPTPEEFPRLCAPMTSGAMPTGWAHAQLSEGRAIVLIDGVDEIRSTRRDSIVGWLRDLTAAYPNCVFVVTSRPSAITEGWLDAIGFVDANLLPMEPDEIDAFIAHWHAAVRQELTDENEKEELILLENHLKRVLRSTPGLAELATSPLLCAMLCAVHRDNRQELPTDRVELYEVCTYALLEKRDLERRVELHDYPHLTYRQKKLIVQDLAYWMLKNGWARIHYAQALEQIQLKLARMRELPVDADAEGIIRLLTERSGLVREPSQGEVDFTHRTFQEYFAALAVIDENDIGLLISKVGDDQWREVVILAAGAAPAKTRAQLINALLANARRKGANRLVFVLLAVSCLQSTIEMAQSEQERIRHALKQIMPPQNEEQARGLAGAGELAVAYLSPSPGYSESETALCVRTLSLIGSDSALERIAAFAQDKRSQVVYEILRAARVFDEEKYKHLVLTNCQPEAFEFNSLSSIEILVHIPGLRRLKIPFSSKVEDLSILGNMHDLEDLDLSGCENVRDLAPLTGLIKLQHLNLAGCRGLMNIEPLAGLTELKTLDISETQVSTLAPLSGLENLTNLRAADCIELIDLSPLQKLEKLQYLDASLSLPLAGNNEKNARHANQKGKQGQEQKSDERILPINHIAKANQLKHLDVRGNKLFLLPNTGPICWQLEVLKFGSSGNPGYWFTKHNHQESPITVLETLPKSLEVSKNKSYYSLSEALLIALEMQSPSRFEIEQRFHHYSVLVPKLMEFPDTYRQFLDLFQFLIDNASPETAAKLQADRDCFSDMDVMDRKFIEKYYIPIETGTYNPGQFERWFREMRERLASWGPVLNSELISAMEYLEHKLPKTIGQHILEILSTEYLTRIENEDLLKDALSIQDPAERAKNFNVEKIGAQVLDDLPDEQRWWLCYLFNKSGRVNVKLLPDYLDHHALTADFDKLISIIRENLLGQITPKRNITPSHIHAVGIGSPSWSGLWINSSLPREDTIEHIRVSCEDYVIDGLIADSRLLNEIPSSESLRELSLDGYKYLDLRFMSERFHSLNTLRIAGDPGLKTLEGIEKLALLKTLILENCTGIKHLRSVEKLTNLSHLVVHGCSNEVILPDVNFLGRLENAEIIDSEKKVLFYTPDYRGQSSSDSINDLRKFAEMVTLALETTQQVSRYQKEQTIQDRFPTNPRAKRRKRH